MGRVAEYKKLTLDPEIVAQALLPSYEPLFEKGDADSPGRLSA